ncbi:hypothetical protein [Micromonospora okii]|uniref:hypothetical protein n=1 Tax=Micromonospora okii TaxID=1182970 RepID=UPI001E4AF825|nr:hypothetical protein [Micromonospora okii]
MPATGGPGYSASLSARLLTADSVPAGFTVQIATVMASDAGERRPGPEASCSEMIPLLSGTRLTGTPSAMAAATLGYDGDPDDLDLWVGSEVLRTYADDGARRAMADLRTFVGRCPVVSSGLGDGSTSRFTVAPGPRLGDDSIRLGCNSTSDSDTLRCEALIVRTGSTLLVIKGEGGDPGGDRYVTPLAEAALHRYRTTGS